MFGEKWQKGAQRWFLYVLAVGLAIGAVAVIIAVAVTQ